jgi:hypothetical protein
MCICWCEYLYYVRNCLSFKCFIKRRSQVLRLSTFIYYNWLIQWRNSGMILKSKTKVLGEKFVRVPLCPPWISRGLAWYRSWSCTVWSWRLTAWALVRQSNYINTFHFPVFLTNCNEQWNVFFILNMSIEVLLKNQRPSSVFASLFCLLITKTNNFKLCHPRFVVN